MLKIYTSINRSASIRPIRICTRSYDNFLQFYPHHPIVSLLANDDEGFARQVWSAISV